MCPQLTIKLNEKKSVIIPLNICIFFKKKCNEANQCRLKHSGPVKPNLVCFVGC